MSFCSKTLEDSCGNCVTCFWGSKRHIQGVLHLPSNIWVCCTLLACLLMQSDDRVIKEEGIDNLTDDELRGACRSRGMRTPYGEGAVTFMRKQLQEWLDLSLNRYCQVFVHLCSSSHLCSSFYLTPCFQQPFRGTQTFSTQQFHCCCSH